MPHEIVFINITQIIITRCQGQLRAQIFLYLYRMKVQIINYSKEHRKGLGLTRKELAKRSGVSRQSINSIEQKGGVHFQSGLHLLYSPEHGKYLITKTYSSFNEFF